MRPSDDDLLELVKNHFEKCLMVAEDDIFLNYQDLRDGIENQFDYDRKVQVLRNRHGDLLKISQTQQFLPEQEIEAQALLDWKGYILAPFSAAYKNFLEALVDAKVEAARLTLAKFQKDVDNSSIRLNHLQSCTNFLEKPNYHLLEASFEKPYHLGVIKSERPSITLGQAINEYIEYRNEPTKWKERVRSHLDRISDLYGSDKKISELTKVDARNIERQLWKIPTNYKKKFDGVPLKEFLDGARGEYETLASNSVKLYFFAIKKFFDWCLETDYMSTDIFKNVKLNISLSRDDDKSDRRAYFPDELKYLFASPVFTGRMHEKRRLHIPGNLTIRDGYFWVPLLGLMSGLRLGEILQLTIADIKWDREIPYLDVNNFGEKTLKNAQSARGIPIHPVLKKIGFIEYVSRRTSEEVNSSARLFDGLTYPKQGKIIKNFSRFFSQYLKDLGLKKSSETVFHSLRHNYVSAMRRACGNNPEVMGPLDGRKETEKSRGTRALYGFNLEPHELYPYVEKMDFKVDLSHLYSTEMF